MSSMASCEGAGGSKEWDTMNKANIKMMNSFMKSTQTKVNVGQQIGVKMVEWVD